jgi:hypothetical protein
VTEEETVANNNAKNLRVQRENPFELKLEISLTSEDLVGLELSMDFRIFNCKIDGNVRKKEWKTLNKNYYK